VGAICKWIITYQRKLGSNLPSYGWLLPDEGRCETLHHIRIHSMKGAVRLWRETWNHITMHSMKGAVRLWRETWNHITMHSMKGGVRLWCETWHHITIHSCNGCMIVVIWCCHVRRYMRVSHVMLQNALWWLHERCMGHCVGEETGARNRAFFRVKWLQPAMKGTSCVRWVRVGSFIRNLVPPLCSATSGCSCVRNSMRFLNLWLQIALEWLHDCSHLVMPCA